MGRPRSKKPWHHAPSGYWCCTVNGKREYLDRDYKLACRKLNELRSKVKREEAGGKEWLDAPFAELVDEYLTDIKARRKSTTYVSARYRLLRALEVLGTKVRVGEVRKSHLAKIEAQLTGSGSYSPTTIKDTLVIVSGVFNVTGPFPTATLNCTAGGLAAGTTFSASVVTLNAVGASAPSTPAVFSKPSTAWRRSS